MGINLAGIGHVLMRVADIEASRHFYQDVLGFTLSEEDPDHGGVFMRLGNSYHTLDISPHPSPENAQRPARSQVGLHHIGFKVDSYAALRDAYIHLVESGVAIDRAMDHANQRSLYFADPDGNNLEIYYELPRALEIFADGRGDLDETLPLTGKGEPLPGWIAGEWPGAEMTARIAGLGSAGEVPPP